MEDVDVGICNCSDGERLVPQVSIFAYTLYLKHTFLVVVFFMTWAPENDSFFKVIDWLASAWYMEAFVAVTVKASNSGTFFFASCAFLSRIRLLPCTESFPDFIP